MNAHPLVLKIGQHPSLKISLRIGANKEPFRSNKDWFSEPVELLFDSCNFNCSQKGHLKTTNLIYLNFGTGVTGAKDTMNYA